MTQNENYENVPRTDNLALPLPSQVDDPTALENEWGTVLDHLLIERLDGLLGGGQGDLEINSISSTEQNLNRVYDTAGRYHGELTGEDDAEVVNDAIADRHDGSSIVVPDPGFTLDWNERVEIPVEDGFGIYTKGNPEITPEESFDDDVAFYRGAGTSRHQYIDAVFVNDEHGVLEWAFDLTDLKSSTLFHPRCFNCPGIILRSVETWSNNNAIYAPAFRYPGEWSDARNSGVGIRFNGEDPRTPNQNWIFAPYYNASKDFEAGDVAFVDRGKHNNWILGRTEYCYGSFDFYGRNYYVSIANFDRAHESEFTIRENDVAYGFIEGLQGRGEFELLQILSPNTQISHTDRKDDRSGTKAVNLGDNINRLSTSMDIEYVGLFDNSEGGTVEPFRAFERRTWIRMSTDTTSGSYTETCWGDPNARSIRRSAFPKMAMSFRPTNEESEDDVLARMGVYTNESNYAEVIYDPTNEMGGHGTDSWWLESVVAGERLGNTEVDTDTFDVISIGMRRTRDGNQIYAAADNNDVETVPFNYERFDDSEMRIRWYVETLDDTEKAWGIYENYGISIWTL